MEARLREQKSQMMLLPPTEAWLALFHLSPIHHEHEPLMHRAR